MKQATIFFALLFSFLSASALNPAHFTITRISAPYFVVDGNSAATGPLTAYVGFRVTNSSATTYSNLKFTINSVTSSVAGQNYTLTSPASGIVAVGTLAPGESKVCYYYVTYPAHTTAQGTFNYTLSDATASPKTGSFVINNRASISANAGGLATQSINSQDLIGGIVYDDVTYTLGNIRNGDEADFQISVSTQFNPTKLALLKTEVITSTVPGVAAGTTNQLYFTTTANQSSGTVTIRWTFRIAAFNFTSLVLPYAGATSGSSNYKYAISTDLGSGTPIVVSAAANPLIITKTSDKTIYSPNSTAIFTVTIQNPGVYSITIDKITDEIPAGFTYQGLHATSAVTTLNSTSVPAAGTTGTITFEGGVVSGANTSYVVPNGGSIVLKYTATSPATQAINLLTTAKGFIGTTQFGLALNTVHVSTTLPVTLTSFRASWIDSRVKLDWSTESETNSRSYEIERSRDNLGFQKIGERIAQGNSSVRSYYNFVDSFPGRGKNLYRLKMVDQDGKYQYSPVVVMQYQNEATGLSNVYPNPFVGNIQFGVTVKEDQLVHIHLLDESGRAVLSRDQRCYRGANSVVLDDLKTLRTGIYLLQVITSEGSYSAKLARQN